MLHVSASSLIMREMSLIELKESVCVCDARKRDNYLVGKPPLGTACEISNG